ncbi:MAG TPA: ATPase domain-containing protein [Ktedonobacteraceae bacterium]|nr:ATPase domain-containing protein [Ktedonobacteraceae bacterium]
METKSKETMKKETTRNVSTSQATDDISRPPDTLEQGFSYRLTTGIPQLDDIMRGGYIPRRSYVVRGEPGTGKTTVGLHFLAAGATRGEVTLYITVGEPEEQIRNNASSIGLNLKNVAFLDLSTNSEFLSEVELYTFPHEQEDGQFLSITERIIQQIRELKPQRVFLDSMTQLRLVSPDSFQMRKQVLAFLRFLIEQEATVLFTSESSDDAAENDLQVVCDGVINLHYTKEGRTISITKLRGSDFSSGHHCMQLTAAGLQVFPHLLPDTKEPEIEHETITSGVPELDELLHGGLTRGTITIITGPSGVGKTTLGLQFMKEMAGRGEHSIIYAFEEWEHVLISRCESINIPIGNMIERRTLSISQIEPLHYRPDEFFYKVRRDIEKQKTSIVMIDSVAGYRLSIHVDDLARHLHSLCKYLQGMGIAVLLINETETITSNEFRATDLGISYVADNIIFLRYFERNGEMRKAIGVLKKRLTDFERTMREIEITRYGLKVGRPLTEMREILRMPYLSSGQSRQFSNQIL